MIEPTFLFPLTPQKQKIIASLFFQNKVFSVTAKALITLCFFVVYKSLNENNISIISKIYKNKSSHFSLKSLGLY